MDTSTMPPSTAIYLPSGVKSTEDWLILLAADSPARTSQRQADALALTESVAAYGGRCLDAFGKWDPDTSSLRTFQASLWEDKLEQWPESWPVSATLQLLISYTPNQ